MQVPECLSLKDQNLDGLDQGLLLKEQPTLGVRWPLTRSWNTGHSGTSENGVVCVRVTPHGDAIVQNALPCWLAYVWCV